MRFFNSMHVIKFLSLLLYYSMIELSFNEKIVDEWVEIWNNYDLKKVKDLFLDDERVSYFSSEKQGLIKGFDLLVDHHREFGFIDGGKETGNK